ncbi:MAG: serine/threonine protein kinase [Sandaracinaceae bacterium]|nr:serine/threonine protein kinase [Sandaracinaceae bacterium]
MNGSQARATGRAYEPVADIARGGMGRVELVVRREGTFARIYAMKRLHAELSEDREVREMFLEEARIAGLIRHPNVVPVLDVGEDDQGPYLVMDYVEGVAAWRPLVDARRAGELLPVAICAEIARQAAFGLAAAHELEGAGGRRLSVVHRDVSPQNILLGFDGLARVTDFGVARALDHRTTGDEGSVKGKFGYMSPEQVRAEELDARSDLFSFGVVLYELLVCGRLYSGPLDAVVRRIQEEPPPDVCAERSDVPEALGALVRELLSKERAARPASARAVAARLEPIVAAAREAGEDTSIERFMRRSFGDERERQRALVAAALERTDFELPLEATPPVPALGLHDEPTRLTREAGPEATITDGGEPTAETTAAVRTRRAASSNRPLWWAIGVGVTVGAGLAAGWFLADGRELDPELAAPIRAPALPPAPPPTSETAPAPRVETPAEPTLVEAEVGPAVEVEEPAPAERPPRTRRRRTPVRRRSAAGSLARRAWGWDEGDGE